LVQFPHPFVFQFATVKITYDEDQNQKSEMQMVAMAKVKATWNWVRGKSEEAMREALGVGRSVQAGEVETPAMVAGVRRETRHGAGGDEEDDGGDGVFMTVTSAYDYASHAEPQGFFIRPLLSPTNKGFPS
jgi:hypothetical protein